MHIYGVPEIIALVLYSFKEYNEIGINQKQEKYSACLAQAEMYKNEYANSPFMSLNRRKFMQISVVIKL